MQWRRLVQWALLGLGLAATFAAGGCGGASTGSGTPPSAGLTATPPAVEVGQPAHLDASGSTGSCGGTVSSGCLVSFEFLFADGTPDVISASPTVDHAFAAAGSYDVQVLVTDGSGLTARADTTIVVENLPQPSCVKDADCPAGEVCDRNLCVPLPPTCVDPAECPPGFTCIDDKCQPQPSACPEGGTCTGGRVCQHGLCVCPSPLADCGGTCVDLTSDAANCGVCRAACPTGESCSGGVCGGAGCLPPDSLCGTTCVDLATDPANCGSCGTLCPTGDVCKGATCQPPDCLCVSGQICCAMGCVDPTSDSANCGGCGNVCGAGTSCMSGLCRAPCPTGQRFCPPGGCTDTSSDPNNCGGCGIVCAPPASCSMGACTKMACPPGQTFCPPGTCTDTSSDSNNCGGCGIVCPGVPCVGGVCAVMICPPGQTFCPPGTCTDTSSDSNNCGGCGIVCAPPASCSMGACTTPPGMVIATFPSPLRRPLGLTWDGTHFWAADSGYLYLEFDATGATYRTFTLPAGTGYGLSWLPELPMPSFATAVLNRSFQSDENFFNPGGMPTMPPWTGEGGGSAFDGKLLYVFQDFMQSISELDPMSGAMVGGGSIAGMKFGDAVTDMAFDGSYLWACGRNYFTRTDFLYRIDPSALMVNLSIDPVPAPRLGGLTFDGTNLWAVAPNKLLELSH